MSVPCLQTSCTLFIWVIDELTYAAVNIGVSMDTMVVIHRVWLVHGQQFVRTYALKYIYIYHQWCWLTVYVRRHLSFISPRLSDRAVCLPASLNRGYPLFWECSRKRHSVMWDSGRQFGKVESSNWIYNDMWINHPSLYCMFFSSVFIFVSIGIHAWGKDGQLWRQVSQHTNNSSLSQILCLYHIQYISSSFDTSLSYL